MKCRCTFEFEKFQCGNIHLFSQAILEDEVKETKATQDTLSNFQKVMPLTLTKTTSKQINSAFS